MKSLISISDVANALQQNQVGLFPCDTIWGIIGNLNNVRRINRIKQRPLDQPLIWFIRDISQVLNTIAPLSAAQKQLIGHLWPGPYTLLFALKESREKLACRIPDSETLRELLIAYPHPIVSTSANLSGEPVASSPDALSDAISNQIDFIFTNGAPVYNQESSLIDCTQIPPTVLRLGADPKQKLLSWA